MDIAILSEKILDQIKPVLSESDEQIMAKVGDDTWKKFTSVFRTEREKKVLQDLRKDADNLKLTGKAELIIEHIIHVDLKTRSVLANWLKKTSSAV